MSDYLKKLREKNTVKNAGNAKTGAEEKAASDSTKEKKDQEPSTYLEKLRAKNTVANNAAVDSDFIDSFLSDARKYSMEGNTLNARLSYSTSASIYESRKKTADDLRSRASAISQYIEKNRGSIPEEYYKSMKEYLGNFGQYTTNSLHSLYQANKYYSQFKTEEEYKKHEAALEEYQKMSSLDLDAEQKDIAYLESVRKEYSDLLAKQNEAPTYLRGGYRDISDPYKKTQDAPKLDGPQAERLAQLSEEYGSLRDLDKLINEKRVFRKRSEQLQEGITLSGVVENDDFQDYSGYVSTKSDDVWTNISSLYGMGYKDLTYEYINNQNGIRDEIKEKHYSYTAGNIFVDNESHFEEKGYDLLKEDEIAIYNYYYARDGKEKAQEYLDNLQETLNMRKATGMYAEMENQTALELAFGVAAGLDQFKSGMQNLFNTEDDYIAPSAYQMASAMVREDLADAGGKLPDWMGGASIGQVGYDVINTSANMAPSILTSMAVGMINPVAGQWVGSALLGASAAGNAYQEALNQGYSKDQARGYSFLVGVSEAVMEKVLGGISSFGGNPVGKLFTKAFGEADNVLKAIAKNLGGSVLSEFSEEYLQEVLTPVFRNIALGTDEELKLFSAEALYAGILGALTAGVMEGPRTIATEIGTQRKGNELKKAGVTAQRLAEIGNLFAADTVAHRLAGKVNENTGAYTMGRLFNEIGATLTEQNVNDITQALVKNGMTEDIAKKNAEVMAYIIDGGEVSNIQMRMIEKNKILSKVMQEVIIDPNSTLNQRNKGYNDALRALAQEKAGSDASQTDTAEHAQENAPSVNNVDTQTENNAEANVEPAKYGSIKDIKNGKVTIKMDDGSEVDLKDADLDPEDSVRIETITSIDGISAEDASGIFDILKAGSKNSQNDAIGAIEAYRYGYYGLTEKMLDENGTSSKSLTPDQRKAVYEMGQKARQQNVETTTFRKTDAKKAPGKVHYDGDRTVLNERQQVSLKAMDRIASALGVQIYIFESKVGKSGKRIGENGWYDPKDGSIHIDLYAGQDGGATMLFTLAHELTHYIRQWSPQKFKILADFLMEEYGKNGVNVSKLIREQQSKAKRNGRTISYDTAYEEVVADSMEMMLSDGNVMKRLEKLKAQDKDLWSQIKRFIDDMAAKIRAVYRDMKPDSKEAEFVMEMGDTIYRLQELFTEGLVEASENFQSAEKNTTEGGVMYMSRDIADVTEDTVRADLTDVFDGKNVTSKSYIPLAKTTPFAVRHITGYKEDLPIIVEKKKAYFDMREDGIFKEDGSHHYHGMGIDGFIDALDILNDPEYAIREEIQNGNIHFAFISTNEDGYEVCIAFQMAVFKPEYTMNGFPGGYYNLDITEFVATDEWLEAHGVEPGTSYVDYLLSFNENSLAYDRRFHLEQLEKARTKELEKARITDVGSAGLAASHINNRAFEANVPQTGPAVNNESTEAVDVEVDTKTEAEFAEEQVEQANWALAAQPAEMDTQGKRFSSRDTSGVPGNISDFVDTSLSNKRSNAEIEVSLATQWDNKVINRLGPHWKGKYTGALRTFNSRYVRHVMKQHGDPIIEALRGQLHMDADAIKIALSNLKAGKGSIVEGTYAKRGTPTIITEIPINGYTIYAEEPVQTLDGIELSGRTMYMTPTSTKALMPTGSANIPQRRSEGHKVIIDGKKRIVNGFLTDASGNIAEVNYIDLNGSAYAGGTTRFLFTMCNDADVLLGYAPNGATVEKARVAISNPYIVTTQNPVFSTEDLEQGLVGDRIKEIRSLGFDAIIMDYKQGDNYMTLAFDKKSIVKLSDRDTDSVSNRSLLSGTDVSTIKNEVARKKLADYQKILEVMNAEDQKLREIRAEIKELSFAKGQRDSKKLKDLKLDAIKINNNISVYEGQLQRMEKELQSVVKRERSKVLKEAEKRDKAELAKEWMAAQVKQSETLREYRETRAALRQQESDTAVMEKEFIRIAKEYEKLGEKSGKTISNLRTKLKNEAKQHRADEKMWMAEFSRLMREYEAADRNIDRLEQKIERQKAVAKERVESRGRTAMRHKIQNVVGELNSLLLTNDKKRHVPESLKKAVAEALDLVNMDTVGAEEQVAKYAKLIAEEQAKANPNQDKIDAYTMTMENILRKGEKMGQRLKELHDAYEEIQQSDDPDIANAYDPVIAGNLKELSQSIGNTSIRNMSLEQLSDVYDMYRMVLTRVRDANNAMQDNIKENISNLASRTIGEVRMTGGDHKYRAAILDPVMKFLWNNTKPVYAMEWIGSSTLTKVFNNVRAGEDVWAKDVTEAREYYLDKSKKYGYDSWNFEKKYPFESVSGEAFELTLEQILSLYAYSKREQADEHLKLGGFVFDSNIETYKEKDEKTGKSLLKYKVNTADAYQITPEIMEDITGKLDPEQIAFVDEMQEYLSTVMGSKGNEVTMKMYGVKLFKEKFYFPLKSAKQFMFEQNEVSGEVRIKNSGFTNKVVAEANNPVILSNFMDVWAGHVNDMSMYHAFTLPLEDFNRVFNYNTPKKEGQAPVSVKGTIQNAYGPSAVSYVKQLITDLNGGARSDSTTGPINKLMGMFKKGAVFASLSVVVQQPSAIARAAALVDTKYFIGPKLDQKRHKALWEEVKQYAPVTIIKEMGYFDTNMGKSTQDFITSKEHDGWIESIKRMNVKSLKENTKDLIIDSDYRDEVLSWGPAFADELAWCGIWEAVKRETNAKHPDMDVKSEAFLKLAGERFTEVITKTQVYDSVLARSANMRSKDTGMKMATAFMAEPTTSINMIADALLQGKRGNRKYCRAAIGAVVASQILNSILVSFVYAGRDDDEEKTYWEKYASNLVGNTIESINPLGYIPFIKDIISIVKGYDVERSDMSVISDLWKAYESLGKDNVSVYRKVEGFAGSIAQIFGLPVKNIMRDVRGIYQTVSSLFIDGESGTIVGLGYAISEGFTGKEISNGEQLLRAHIRSYEGHLKRVMGRYETEEKAKSALKQAIKNRYITGEIDAKTARDYLFKYAGEEIDETYWIVKKWNYDLQQTIKKQYESGLIYAKKARDYLSKYAGVEIDETDKIVKSWDYAIENGIDDDYQKYGELYEAVRTGKDLKKTIKEYTDNGVKQDTLRGQITEHFKPEYLKMSTSERAAIKGYIVNGYVMTGMDREDAMDKIGDWDFEANNGYDWSERASAYKNEEISAEELRQDLIEFGGYDADDADAQIEAYDWQADGYEDVTAAAVQQYNAHCADSKVPKDIYLHIRKFSNNTENDVDQKTGKKVRHSAMKKVIAEIDAQNLSAAQKTAIARSLGWADKNIQKYKTW